MPTSPVPRTIELSALDDELSTLDYPVQRGDAVVAFEDVAVHLADGQVNLGEAIADSSVTVFESEDELAGEVRSNLPREAVGEPFQSEGEG